MSGVSKGSQTATNTFIVLGIVALLALAFATGRDDNPPEPQPTCAERLVSMGPVVWDPLGAIPHPGQPQLVTLDYTVDANGNISAIQVTGQASKFDAIAITALNKSRYRPHPDAVDLLCSHTYRLQID